MDFAMRSCHFCSEQIFARSTRCIHCLKEYGATKPLSIFNKTKTAALHISWAVMASLAVSAVFRHPVEPAIAERSIGASASAISALSAPPSRAYPKKEESVASEGGFSERMARDSIEEMRQTIRRNPTDYLAYEARGWLYFKELGEGQKAIRDLSIAIALRPKWAQPYAERAWVHHFLGNDRQALADARRALRREPDNRQARDAIDAISQGPNR